MRLAWLLVLAVLPRLAAAAPDEAIERARTHLRAGIAYYDEARYDDAAREIEAAFALRPLPDLQYNLAQCYERAGRIADAIAAYHKYLDGKTDADDRRQVETRIANLEERAKSGQPQAPLPAEKVVFKTIVVYREAPPRPGRGARFAAYGLAVLAIGGLATGIAFSVLARLDGNQVTQAGSVSAPIQFGGSAAAQTQAAAHTDVIVAGVAFGAAAASALGAIGLFWLGHNIDKEAPKLSLAPALAPGTAGLALAGSF